MPLHYMRILSFGIRYPIEHAARRRPDTLKAFFLAGSCGATCWRAGRGCAQRRQGAAADASRGPKYPCQSCSALLARGSLRDVALARLAAGSNTSASWRGAGLTSAGYPPQDPTEQIFPDSAVSGWASRPARRPDPEQPPDGTPRWAAAGAPRGGPPTGPDRIPEDATDGEIPPERLNGPSLCASYWGLTSARRPSGCPHIFDSPDSDTACWVSPAQPTDQTPERPPDGTPRSASAAPAGERAPTGPRAGSRRCPRR